MNRESLRSGSGTETDWFQTSRRARGAGSRDRSRDLLWLLKVPARKTVTREAATGGRAL